MNDKDDMTDDQSGVADAVIFLALLFSTFWIMAIAFVFVGIGKSFIFVREKVKNIRVKR